MLIMKCYYLCIFDFGIVFDNIYFCMLIRGVNGDPLGGVKPFEIKKKGKAGTTDFKVDVDTPYHTPLDLILT